MQKFATSDREGIRKYFADNGYVVVTGVLGKATIDRFIRAYEAIRQHPLFVYYSQSLHVGMRPVVDEHGFIRDSMQNASRLAFFRDFAKSCRACLYDAAVGEALCTVTGRTRHVSWQNMFFDRSTGTVEHQDSWYLDTDPPGNLVGVWYALEDIQAASGPFFVVPGSHQQGLIERDKYPDHEQFVTESRKRIRDSGLERKALLVDKGDIVLWHPYLIHGAFECEDDQFSRKSFTSHFYPVGCRPKDTESEKLFSIYNHGNPRATFNPDIESAFRYSDYFYHLLVYGLFIKDRLLSVSKRGSMRREDYAEFRAGE